MNIMVEGISIELTSSQRAIIKKGKLKRATQCKGFVNTLKHFGFIHKKDVNIENQPIEWFEHPVHNWYAEILDHTNFKEVWMTGKYLKESSSFPGGWIYSEATDLAEELTKATDFINNHPLIQ